MSLTSRQIDEIRRLTRGRVQVDLPLSGLTSFKVGGPADLVVEPEDVKELAALLGYLHQRGIPRFVLGAGTNVLFRDAGFRGVVVRTGGLRRLEIYPNGSDHGRIVADAGVPFPVVVGKACSGNWTGLEPLWGIPGSFGGAIVTNAGSGGTSTGDFLVELRLLDEDGTEICLQRSDLVFGYRHMQLPLGAMVVQGTLRLHKGDGETIEANLEKSRSQRRSSQPWSQPSAGCVFKNPSPENPAGAIIDRMGFKGMTIGGAAVSEVHANFIINRGNATASDILELIDTIRGRVKQEEQIELELEIRVEGEETTDI